MKNSPVFQRRKPRQARSQMSYDSILEAAAQLLERDGTAGLNTNRIAERAGVSVGTLYQYFPNKESILIALARRELANGLGALGKSLFRALTETLDLLMHGPRTVPRSKLATRVGAQGRAKREPTGWQRVFLNAALA